MKSSIFALSVLAASAFAQTQTPEGTGPYKAVYAIDSALPNHTFYQPADPAAVNGTLPVIVWGNGGCSANSLSHRNFILEIASWGFLVIVSGEPNARGSTTAKVMTDSIDFIVKAAGTGKYAKVDATKIAAAGQSCGGVETYEQHQDARVRSLGIFNSGQMSAAETNRVLPTLTKSLFIFNGGSSDIAYANGVRDYATVKPGTPAFHANLPVGHGGTYSQPNGGKFGIAGQNWARWVLKGDQTAKTYLTGGGLVTDGWTVESKDLDKIVVG